jgi:hypothetical protein
MYASVVILWSEKRIQDTVCAQSSACVQSLIIRQIVLCVVEVLGRWRPVMGEGKEKKEK